MEGQSGSAVPESSPSRLARRLCDGHFVVTAEINPPRHADPEGVRTEARLLRGAVDAVNLTDCTRGIVRMSSIAAAFVLKEEGVEPIVQMTCRDRNKIALQSELLGLPAMGIHNAMLLTGDNPAEGDHPDAKPVFELNGTSLLAAANGLRQGTLLSGRKLAHAPALFLGAAGDPERDLAQTDPARMPTAEKLAAGVDFVQTQPVFDVARFSRWIDVLRENGILDRVAVLAGVFYLDSARRADFLRKVPGVVMPVAMAERMASANDEKAEGLAIARELVEQLRAVDGVRGVHLMGIDASEAIRHIADTPVLASAVSKG
ncbi:MAG TPA: methylenetetrahydrofolate reductase [Chloroflexota bacterium]|nr:methylenetetrahydrofolate reductase [Chloroflexota bacterium]